MSFTLHTKPATHSGLSQARSSVDHQQPVQAQPMHADAPTCAGTSEVTILVCQVLHSLLAEHGPIWQHNRGIVFIHEFSRDWADQLAVDLL